MNIEEKFLKYVSFDSQSDPHSTTCPSSLKQRDLGDYLVMQMKDLGIDDAHIDEYGIVYGTIESNGGNQDTMGFIAHMDTSPDASGKDIRPQKVMQYDGGVITLNKEKEIYLDPKDFPALQEVIGHDLITTDGTTLLGADDKAGIAIIMEMAQHLYDNPGIVHGTIKIAFTPDEEVGRGTDHFDVDKFGATYAYTMDGGNVHLVGYENFNAYGANVTITGRSVHPGSAKNEMINASRIAMEFESMLPIFDKPEYTEGYEGFIHLHTIHGGVEETKMEYILRDHDLQKVKKQINTMLAIKEYLNAKYGYSICHVECVEQYLNMYEILKNDMTTVNKAFDAMNALQLEPKADPIRGGTDGARLTFRNLPCPNLGTGGYNYHGRFEYVSLTMMKQAVELVLELLK